MDVLDDDDGGEQERKKITFLRFPTVVPFSIHYLNFTFVPELKSHTHTSKTELVERKTALGFSA